MIDASGIRKDFPIFRNRNLVYLDNAATTQKPEQVIEAISSYYSHTYSNVHRGVYKISEEATELYENARKNIAGFIGLRDPESLIFLRNTTEAINLLSYSLSHDLHTGDEVLLTQMEHHSNIVPWQFLEEKGVKLKFASIDSNGLLDMDDFYSRVNSRTRIISLCHVSNVLGTINPVSEICSFARDRGIISIVDGAQSVPHMPVDVHEIGADFYAFSGHKMLGPSGIGGLAGNPEMLRKMHPFLGGGEMISSVTFQNSTYADIPMKFEAGTQNVEGAIGLSSAVDYLRRLGMDEIRKHEKDLIGYILKLERESGPGELISFGPEDPELRGGVYTFNLGSVPAFDLNRLLSSRNVTIGRSVHPHDLAAELDRHDIAIRSGHHCAMPLMGILDQAATARASFYIYNGREDADLLMETLSQVREAKH